jgi:exosortase A
MMNAFDRFDALHAGSADPTMAAHRRAWRVAIAAICLYTAWLVAWYFDTVASMVSIWYRSETFAHGFTILPISLWLVWQKRRELARLAPAARISFWPLAAIAVATVLWLLGDLADVLAARHFAWVTLLIAGIWMILGTEIARRLAFPLAFLYLAVPFGEFMVPTLIEWTANFTVSALRASGVPVLRDGMTFQIPSGSWSVVEACSGVRYLIASFTVGLLYAYVTYRTLGRRVAFVIASLIVPIFANWLRAYGIVMIGHLSNNRLAVGIDHIIYGWIFFGVVMLLLFWAGTLFQERQRPAQIGDTDGSAAPPGPGHRTFAAPLVYATVLVASLIAPGVLRAFPQSDGGRVVDAVPPTLGEWQPVAESLVDWRPAFLPPRATIASTYARGGERVGLLVAVYYDQSADSKLVSSSNVLVDANDHTRYVASQRERTVDLGGRTLPVQDSILRLRGESVLARTWYWIDGTVTASPARAKLAQLRERLLGRGDSGAIVVVYGPLSQGGADSAGVDDLTREVAAKLPGILAERLRARDTP